MSHRNVAISGAATGLGLALTKRFLETGDTVYGITRTRRHWITARKNLSDSKNFYLFQADLCYEKNVKQTLSAIGKRAGRIDVLINSAGYGNRPVRIEKETVQEFQKNFSSNLLSVFLMCKYALPFFQKQKSGWIINIASMAGKRAVPFLAAYSASKFGVLAISQSVAKENQTSGFKCITVCPGGMNTAMRAKIFGVEDAKRQQSADFVAEKIVEIINGGIAVESGGDISIRHGKITAINPPPEA